VHEYGFSPVWVRKCTAKSDDFAAENGHKRHVCGFSCKPNENFRAVCGDFSPAKDTITGFQNKNKMCNMPAMKKFFFNS
jgi:hypothetical protein